MQSRQSATAALRPITLEWLAALLTAGLAVVRLVVAAATPLSPDEAYYWLWTRPLQLSYFDHPGMVAWWIWLGTHLCGDTALGVRLPAILAAAATTILVWDAARAGFSSRRAGAIAAIWLNATILFASAAVLITPDSPLLLFWSLALWALIRLVRAGRARWLYLAAAAIGLGAVSKYTMALLVPGVLAAFIIFPALRIWWQRRHFWLALLLATACATPLLWWNAENGWVSLRKQAAHGFAEGAHHRLASLGAFLGGQVALVTPLLFVFVVWGMGWSLAAGWRRGRADWFILGATALPVLAFFALDALDTTVQANWPGPAYLGGLVACVGAWTLRGRAPRRDLLFVAAPMLGFVLVVLVYVQAATALLPLPPRLDPFHRLAGGAELAAAVDQARRAHPGAFLFVRKHEVAGLLSFYLPDHPLVFLSEGNIRPSFYAAADVAGLRGRDALLVTRAAEGDNRELGKYFARMSVVATVALHWGGRPVDSYAVTLAEGYKGGLFVMGDGMPGSRDSR